MLQQGLMWLQESLLVLQETLLSLVKHLRLRLLGDDLKTVA
jgi:hypothetical protein